MIYLILALGLILRLISLNQSLWLDEATSALVAKMSLTDMFTKFLPNDFHPPLYYLILKMWASIFGYSEISLRMPSVIFGVVTIYLVYKISKSRTAALFAATSGLLIYYSQEARMYSLITMLVAFSIYVFREKKWVLFSIAILLIGASDYVGLLILPIFWVFGYKDLKKLFLSHIPLSLSYLLYSPIFLSQIFSGISVRGSNWWNILGQPTLVNLLLIPTKFMIGRIGFVDDLVYGTIVIVLTVFVGYLLFRSIHSNQIFWYWLITPIMLGFLLSFKIPVLSYFRFTFCLPALYILIAQSKVPKIFFTIFMFVNIISSGYYLMNHQFQREDWRAAAEAIGDSRIVLPAASQKEALIYYGKEKNIVTLSELNKKYKTVWLSRYVWELFDAGDSTRLKLESLGYNKTSEYNFNGVVFYKYNYENSN